MRVLALSVLFGTLVALGFVGRVAWIDWVAKDATRASLARAIGLAPQNWAYYRDLGELVGDRAAGERVEWMRRAVAVNPFYAPIRIELAETAEFAGDMGEAERSLRKALELDRTSTPGVLLAEFYFRRGEAAKFWGAARAVLERAEDPDPEILNEMVALVKSGQKMPEDAVPERAVVLRRYLAALLGPNGDMRTAGVVARKLKTEDLKDYCERALEFGLVGEVRSVCAGQGMEWRNPPVGGVYYEKDRITFTGKEPEQCALVWRWVVLEKGKHYRLRTKYRLTDSDEGKGESGLEWLLMGAEGSGALMKGGREWREEAFEFEGPEEDRVGKLGLRYSRVKGTVRFEGSLEMPMPELEVVP